MFPLVSDELMIWGIELHAEIVHEGADLMTRPKVYDPVVPLFLIATAVADGVRKRGGKLYRISVVREHSHAYRIK